MVGMQYGRDDNRDALLTPFLFEAGVIREPSFSFLLSGLEGQSYLDFGTPDINAMSNANDLVYVDVTDRNGSWWTNAITGFKWDLEGATEFKLDKAFAMTDTGQSCLSGPPEIIEYINEKLFSLIENPEGGTELEYGYF